MVNELDHKLLDIVHGRGFKEILVYSAVLQKHSYFKLSSIKELNESLKQNEQAIIKFAYLILKDIRFEELSRGISLYYLMLYLIAKTQNEQTILEFLNFGGGQINGGLKLTTKLINAYKKINTL